MALTNKEKKKLSRFVRSAEDRLKDLMTEQAIQYFVAFCAILVWDRFLGVQIAHHNGIGFIQGGIAVVCLFQSIRFAIKAGK